MFSKEANLQIIFTFGPMNIIRATLRTLHPSIIKEIRMALLPHWSDDYNPSLDQYFTKSECRLCGMDSILSRKDHFYDGCEPVKAARDKSSSVEEFERLVWTRK